MKRRHVLRGLLAFTPVIPVVARAPALTPSGPVQSRHENEVIENLDIVATSGDALTIFHPRVIVRNCRIHHDSGHGIHAAEAADLELERLDIIRGARSVPDGEAYNNIHLSACPGSVLKYVRARSGSSNIYIEQSPGCQLRSLELHDARGPFPRGQNVQFNQSPGSLLEDFSGENGPESWTEDNVSVFQSDRCTVRRGLVFYNNSPTGDGVMLEGSSDCVVQDVDAVEQGNGAFAAVPGDDARSGGCVFLRCRTRDSYFGRRDGRQAPESNGLSIYVEISPGARKHTVADCHYYRLAHPTNLVWDARSLSNGWSFTPMAFTARNPIRLAFTW